MFFLNGKKLEFTKFPNKEIGLDQDNRMTANLRWRYEGDHEIFQLKVIADHFNATILTCEYLPYSRMDRVKGNWAFSLKSLAEIINSCDFAHVNIAEPHSDVCLALIDNAQAYYPTREHFSEVAKDIGYIQGKDVLVFPDAGAEKRYAGMYDNHRYFVGYKERDFNTGKIKRFNLIDVTGGEGNGSHRKAIIIDDLCSYGGTFAATAEALRRDFGIIDTYLLVAHLETNVHSGDMISNSLIKKIYATDSIYKPLDVYALRPHPKIHLLKESV